MRPQAGSMLNAYKKQTAAPPIETAITTCTCLAWAIAAGSHIFDGKMSGVTERVFSHDPVENFARNRMHSATANIVKNGGFITAQSWSIDMLAYVHECYIKNLFIRSRQSAQRGKVAFYVRMESTDSPGEAFAVGAHPT
ncbi:hypothetical protein QR680_012554 [Steinernema hermaphroditum]|uniref:Uncharacterized protein n=1 Tax=Steinernema hermaphroditum TaxID=289476 RepID=A0AA39I4P1_9BILA|nr:hypothetical protein QR680_012554 [Steinernema hermaphroditum]